MKFFHELNYPGPGVENTQAFGFVYTGEVENEILVRYWGFIVGRHVFGVKFSRPCA